MQPECWPGPVQVNYINAHATSTLVGDIAEVKAVKSVFSDWKHIAMNGTKSMIGHGLGAAGGLEAVATIKAIQTGWVHPTINQVMLNCLCMSVEPGCVRPIINQGVFNCLSMLVDISCTITKSLGKINIRRKKAWVHGRSLICRPVDC
jgi:3-oxoacyl-(acyl-carrier-protein) synthase